MKLSGRPLLDTRPDHELFVDRVEEIARIRAALGQGLNCLVVGERGSGKTSLVRALMFEERQEIDAQDVGLPRLLYVRGSGAESASDLLRRAVEALAQYQGEQLAAGLSGTPSGLIAELGERARRGSVLMVLDDAPAAAGNALFGALRDELWSIDLRWLVTVATTDSATLLRPPADAFFESQVTLDPLPADASPIRRRRISIEASAGSGSRVTWDSKNASAGGRSRVALSVVATVTSPLRSIDHSSSRSGPNRALPAAAGASSRTMSTEPLLARSPSSAISPLDVPDSPAASCSPWYWARASTARRSRSEALSAPEPRT